MTEHELTDHEQRLLVSALQQMDIAADAGAIVREQGSTYSTRGMIRTRPEVTVERNATALAAKLFDQLDLKGKRTGLTFLDLIDQKRAKQQEGVACK